MGVMDILSPWRQVRLAQAHLENGEAQVGASLMSTLNLKRLTQGRRARAMLLKAELHAELGEVGPCLDTLEAALALQPRPSLLRQRACAIHESLSRGGHHREALKAVDLGLSLGADDPGLLLARCRSLVALGRLNDGAAGYRLLLARDPSCDGALLGLARLRMEAGEDPEEAIKLCLRALALNPPNPDLRGDQIPILHLLARAWNAQGNPEACVSFFRDMPHEAGWIRAYGLGVGLHGMGEQGAAEEILLDAIREDEGHPFIYQVLRDIKGTPQAPLSIYDVRVKLTWQGSHIPSMARMLPEGLRRTFRVGASSEADALSWMNAALPRRVFEPNPEVLSNSVIDELPEGNTGLFAIFPDSTP